MADVEKDFYNLDEVKNGVPERLNSCHPDLETGDTSIECVKYSVFCKTLEALEFLWQEYESLELNKLITSVTITEETLKKIGAVYLEIETALDIEEYYDCKRELEQTHTASEDGESVALTEKYRDLQSKHEELRTEYEALKRQKENSDAENRLLKIRNENLEEEKKKLSKFVESRKLDQQATGTEKQLSHDVIAQEEDTQSVQPAGKRRKVPETLKDTGSQALSEEKSVTMA
ncbi:uncharacterized protein [Ptychodera flava]|uniref:uncharacterized protein isoform X2 n=1 Tax=Ptychodera flava TaxID=63121 RepID=UPI00396A170D